MWSSARWLSGLLNGTRCAKKFCFSSSVGGVFSVCWKAAQEGLRGDLPDRTCGWVLHPGSARVWRQTLPECGQGGRQVWRERNGQREEGGSGKGVWASHNLVEGQSPEGQGQEQFIFMPAVMNSSFFKFYMLNLVSLLITDWEGGPLSEADWLPLRSGRQSVRLVRKHGENHEGSSLPDRKRHFYEVRISLTHIWILIGPSYRGTLH